MKAIAEKLNVSMGTDDEPFDGEFLSLMSKKQSSSLFETKLNQVRESDLFLICSHKRLGRNL